VTGLPILGTVPMIWTDQEIIKRKGQLYAFGASLLLLVMCYAVLISFTKLPGLAVAQSWLD